MENQISTYGMQCPVIFGVDCIENLAAEVKKMGCSNAFVVYDQGVKATGIGDRILKILEDGGVKATGFDGISAEPIAHVVDEASNAARAAGSDVVIGVGGGSPLDTAKLVAVMLSHPDSASITDWFLSKGPQVMVSLKDHAPLIGVTTASGTGAEVTCVAVVSDNDHRKDGVLVACNLAICDPKLTVTAPPHVTANSGFDALSHALEAFTAGPLEPMTGQGNDPFSTVLAREAISLIVDNLEKCYDDGNNMEARIAMSKAANFAGIAFSSTGVSFGHCIAHEFGSAFSMPHGLACAYTVPVTVYENALMDKELGLELAKAMRVDVTEADDQQTIANALRDKAIAMMKHCHLPHISEKGIESREAAVGCAPGAIANHPEQFGNTVKPLTEERFAELIGMVYDIAEAL